MPRAKRVLTHAEVELCTTGICFDVVGLQYGVIPSDEMKKIVDEFPRLVMHLKVTHYPPPWKQIANDVLFLQHCTVTPADDLLQLRA